MKTAFIAPKVSEDSWYKNNLGEIVTKDNIDSFMPTKTDEWFDSALNNLVELDNKVKANELTWQDYFSTLKNNEKWQIEFVQNTDLQKASLDDVKKAYNSARDAAIAHNAALKQQTLGAKAANVALKGLALAGNMIAMWAITKAITFAVEHLDNFIHSAENATEALEKSSEAFKSSVSEIEDYNSELETTNERITELQRLSDNGTISIADADELKTLKEQNNELERKIALKKQELALEAKQLLNDLDATNGKNYDFTMGGKYSVSTKTSAVNALQGYINQYSWWSDVANGMSEEDIQKSETNMLVAANAVNKSIEAYKSLIDAGFADELDTDYQTLLKVQDEYMKLLYNINKTESNFRTLSSNDKRDILSKQLKQLKGFSDEKIKAIISSVSDEDLNKLYNKSIDVFVPNAKEYTTIQEYGKAYAEAWLNGVAETIEESNQTGIFSIDENQSKALSDYQSIINSISNVYKNLEDYDLSKLVMEFSDYDWSDYANGNETLDTALKKIGSNAYQTIKKAFGDSAKYEPLLSDLGEDLNEVLLSRDFGWSENLGNYNNLTKLLNQVENDVIFTIDEISQYVQDYDLAKDLIKVDGGYKIDKSAIQSLVNKYAEAYNESLAQYRNHLKNQGYSEDFIKGFFGNNNEFKDIIDGSSSSKSTVFDWYETALSRLEDSIDSFSSKVNDTYDTFENRNEALSSQIDELNKKLVVQENAKEAYLTKANSVGLDKKYIDLVQNGYRLKDSSLGIEEITDETEIEKINEYIKWYDKYLNKLNEVEQTKSELNASDEQRFSLITEQFDSELAAFENKANMLNALLENAESNGYIVTQSYYESLKTTEQGILERLRAEKQALEETLAGSGIEKGTQAWNDLNNQISEVAISIQESENALIDFDNKIRQIDWDVFDFARDRESNFMDEADFLIDLLDNKDMFDEIGNMTNEGLTTMGLRTSNYNAYLEQSIKYAEELAQKNKEIANGSYDEKTIKRRDELLELQQESILAAESERDAIISLVEEGIELQKDSLRDLIDEYTTAVNAQRDLYSYQKKTSDQTKKIAQIEKQLAAYANDQSEEARAKVQQLRVSLEDEKDSLLESQFDRLISDQKEILNSIYDDYSDSLDKYMDNTEQVISDAVDKVNQNSSVINKTIEEESEKVGYEVTEELKSVWGDEKTALSTGFNGVKDSVDKGNGLLETYSENTETMVSDLKTKAIEAIANATGDDSTIGKGLTSINNNVGNVNTSVSNVNKTLGEISNTLDTIADNSNKGKNSSSGNSSGSLGSTTGNSNSNSNAGSTSSFSFFKKKYDSYDKDKLNINYSIVDRLKWYNFDSSFAARSYYYSQMGFTDPYLDEEEQNNAMLKWMKKNADKLKSYAKGGYNLKKQVAWTQENGQEYIIRKSDGAILTPINSGSSVLNAEASKNLWDMANMPSKFIMENLTNATMPDFSKINVNGGGRTEIGDISITIPLENVTDVNSFLREFQSNPKVEAIIKDVVASSLGTGSSLAKYRHNF